MTIMDNQFLYILLTAIFVGGAAGYLGTLMLTKRMALVGDALGHVALPGVALAILYNFNLILGAFVSLFVGILLIWLFREKTEIYMEVLTGIVFAGSLALAFLILPYEDLETALIGDITRVGGMETFLAIAVIVIVFIVVRKIFSKMILITMSEDLAVSRGINVKKYNFVYLMSIGIVIALGIKVVGSLLIGALVIIPAAASRNFSRNLFQYSYGGIAIGVLSCISGVILYNIFGFSVGPFAIIASIIIFLISISFRKI